MTMPGARIPIQKPGRTPGVILAGIYAIFLLLILVFAAVWLKVLFVYVALLFMSVVLINGYVQQVDNGLVVFAITKVRVRYDEMKSVKLGPPREPSAEHASITLLLKKPKKVLMTYALPIPVPISEVRFDIPKPDAQELHKSITARLKVR